PFASGIRNAAWFCGGTSAGATVSAQGRQALPGGETRMIFIPVSQVTVHDNWQVLGLQGTGSCDVSVDNRFVPQDMTWVAWENPQRGGPLYRLGRPAFLAAEHAAFALGAGQPLTPQQQVETRSATCYATQVAAEAATLAYRYGGGEANYLTSRLQRCLRDVYGAAQHQLVSNDAYEEHAQGFLGLTGTS